MPRLRECNSAQAERRFRFEGRPFMWRRRPRVRTGTVQRIGLRHGLVGFPMHFTRAEVSRLAFPRSENEEDYLFPGGEGYVAVG